MALLEKSGSAIFFWTRAKEAKGRRVAFVMTDTDVVHVRTKILAYLGELHTGEFVSARKLINDLSLRFTTAKNILTVLEQEWIVEKELRITRRTTQAFFRLQPTNTSTQIPEWDDSYGKHPAGI